MERKTAMVSYNILDATLTGPGLQITVGHQTLADQNLLMSDEIAYVVGHDVRTNILL